MHSLFVSFPIDRCSPSASPVDRLFVPLWSQYKQPHVYSSFANWWTLTVPLWLQSTDNNNGVTVQQINSSPAIVQPAWSLIRSSGRRHQEQWMCRVIIIPISPQGELELLQVLFTICCCIHSLLVPGWWLLLLFYYYYCCWTEQALLNPVSFKYRYCHLLQIT